MATVQERIEAYHQNGTPSDALAQEVIDTLLAQEVLVLFYPQTKHYYLLEELGQPSAMVFSEDATFERFAERCMERGEHVQALRVPPDKQAALYRDLWRCGCTRVIVDYLPRSINFHISDLVEIPDDRELPLDQRTVLAPALLGKLLLMQQGILAKTADGRQTTALLTELYHSPLYLPVIVIQQGGVSGRWVPPVERDGKRMLPAFTDRLEMGNLTLPMGARPVPVWFSTLRERLRDGYDAVLLNPESGAELALDLTLLEAAEKAATGQTQDMELRTLREKGEKITITEPDTVPEEMRERLTACLQNDSSVQTAWLRMMKKEIKLMPVYLVIVDCGEEQLPKELTRAIADAVLPTSDGRSLEVCSYLSPAGTAWVGDAKPLYRKKKRFGFLRH